MTSLFTRFISVILSIIAMFTGGNPEKITMKSTGDITTETTVIEYSIENYTGRRCSFGLDFSIEKYENGSWVELPFDDGYAYIEIAVICKNTQTYTGTINLNTALGHPLEKGNYRLLKNVLINGCGRKTLIYEFSVSE